MIQVQTKDKEYVNGFEAEPFTQLQGLNEPSLLKTKRQEAFAAYEAMPTPTITTEEWRKTDLTRFPFGKLKVSPPSTETEALEEGAWDHHFDVVVCVDDTSYAVIDRTDVLSSGKIQVMSLVQAAEAEPALLETYLQGSALPPSTDKFTALNEAFWNVGFLVHIPKGVVLEKGILIRYKQCAADAVVVPRLLAIAEENAQATIVEHYESPDDITMAAIITKELYVGEGARLKVLTLQEWGDDSYQIENDMAIVQKDGQVDWITLNFGTKISKMKFGSDVAGVGSSAELDGIFFTHDEQHIDQTTLQIHSSPDTYSRLLYKGAVTDESRSVYRGVIQAKPGAIRVDSYQTNNNLVLSDRARADTIPGLLIDADDLKCSHGATIGNLDEDQLFYLRSRGLDATTARQICIMGFFEEIAERIPFDFITERVHATIEKRTATQG